jgi:hypothetical protein
MPAHPISDHGGLLYAVGRPLEIDEGKEFKTDPSNHRARGGA